MSVCTPTSRAGRKVQVGLAEVDDGEDDPGPVGAEPDQRDRYSAQGAIA